jgi:hypothetical protein
MGVDALDFDAGFLEERGEDLLRNFVISASEEGCA